MHSFLALQQISIRACNNNNNNKVIQNRWTKIFLPVVYFFLKFSVIFCSLAWYLFLFKIWKKSDPTILTHPLKPIFQSSCICVPYFQMSVKWNGHCYINFALPITISYMYMYMYMYYTTNVCASFYTNDL